MNIVAKCLDKYGVTKYLESLESWPDGYPLEIYLHHTEVPTLVTWNGLATIRAMQSVYESYDWPSGPHFFVAPEGIWVFTPTNEQGVHVSGHNYRTVGVEMVGCYDDSVPRGAVWANTLDLLSVLFSFFNLDPANLMFHRDYSTKTCPGTAVTKEWVIPQIQERMQCMSKIGLHFQRNPSAAEAAEIGSYPGMWVKLINPPEENPFPGCRIIGRPYIAKDSVIQEQYINQGASGAKAYFEACKEIYSKAPYVEVWEGPNEPLPYYDKMIFLGEFTEVWSPLVQDTFNQKTAGGVLSVGRPDLNLMYLLPRITAKCNFLALHAYSQPTMQHQAEYLTLRYRLIARAYEEAGYTMPDTLLTEVGIDGGAVVPEEASILKAGGGYLDYCTEEEYLSQLKWFRDEIDKDEYIQGATPFVSYPTDSTWDTWSLTMYLMKAIVAMGESQVATLPCSLDEPDGTISFLADKVRWYSEEATRQLEAGNTDNALTLLHDLVNKERGILYRMENQAKELGV